MCNATLFSKKKIKKRNFGDFFKNQFLVTFWMLSVLIQILYRGSLGIVVVQSNIDFEVSQKLNCWQFAERGVLAHSCLALHIFFQLQDAKSHKIAMVCFKTLMHVQGKNRAFEKCWIYLYGISSAHVRNYSAIVLLTIK